MVGEIVSLTRSLAVNAGDIFPIDVVHESIDISRRLGAVVHVIGVLIHIQSENRTRSGQTTGMVCSPLIDEFFVSM